MGPPPWLFLRLQIGVRRITPTVHRSCYDPATDRALQSLNASAPTLPSQQSDRMPAACLPAAMPRITPSKALHQPSAVARPNCFCEQSGTICRLNTA